MNKASIKYKDGYRYQLQEDYILQTPVKPDFTIANPPYYVLTTDGTLYIREGFAWDGATWCPEWLVPPECSLPHDAFCQMLRWGKLDYDKYSLLVHGFLRDMVKERRGSIAALAVFSAVCLAKGGHPDNSNDNPVKTDP